MTFIIKAGGEQPSIGPIEGGAASVRGLRLVGKPFALVVYLCP